MTRQSSRHFLWGRLFMWTGLGQRLTCHPDRVLLAVAMICGVAPRQAVPVVISAPCHKAGRSFGPRFGSDGAVRR